MNIYPSVPIFTGSASAADSLLTAAGLSTQQAPETLLTRASSGPAASCCEDDVCDGLSMLIFTGSDGAVGLLLPRPQAFSVQKSHGWIPSAGGVWHAFQRVLYALSLCYLPLAV